MLLKPTLPNDEARAPCLNDAGRAVIKSMREHPDVPTWTYAVGDRMQPRDLDALDDLRERLVGPPLPRRCDRPSANVLAALAGRSLAVPWMRDNVPDGIDLEAQWAALPTTDRAALAAEPWRFVPDDVDLERLIIYRTAGSTGHPLVVPHHPSAIAAYLALIERALRWWRIPWDPAPGDVACFLLSAQLLTYTYCTALSGWQNAGFAKLNLRPTDWREPAAVRRYLEHFDPPLLNGEPLTFAELLQTGAKVHPRAMLSTSVALSPSMRAQVAEATGAAVLDWYSTVETGPLAVSHPDGVGMALVADDVHVEILRPDGTPAPFGERGEIAVSGGRNPYLPLWRYRTGDRGVLRDVGGGEVRLLDLHGRAPVRFRAADGTPVGSVDVSRALRELGGLLSHRLRQTASGDVELTFNRVPDINGPDQVAIEQVMARLFGDRRITVKEQPRLFAAERAAGRKPVVWQSAFDVGRGRDDSEETS